MGRATKRFKIVEMNVRGNVLFAEDVRIHDISFDGACISSSKYMTIGRKFTLKLGYKGKDVPLKALVMWARLSHMQRSPGGEMVPMYTVGIKFLDDLKAKGISLNDFISEKVRYLDKNECRALLSACGPELRPTVVAALTTGMTEQELLSLKWVSVDMDRKLITVAKSDAAESRDIPIGTTLTAAFAETKNRDKEARVFYAILDGDKMKKRLERDFSSALKKTGIEDLSFDVLRHTFASHLVVAGADLVTVKELLGHKTLEETLRYAHLAPKHKVKAVAIMDRKLASG